MSEETLNLKTLQSHLIKTVIGSAVVAIFSALISSFSFYYKTTGAIDTLIEKQAETRKIVDTHSEILAKSITNNSVSDVQIQNLERRMTSMESTQKDILNILLEINASQKMLVKNSK